MDRSTSRKCARQINDGPKNGMAARPKRKPEAPVQLRREGLSSIWWGRASQKALFAMCQNATKIGRPSIRRLRGAGLNFVPRIVAVVGLAVAGLCQPALAGGLSPGNGGVLLPPLTLPPSSQDPLTPFGVYSGFDVLGQKFGVQNGRLDFFSVHPDDSGDFKPLLRGGVGSGGLQLQLKW